MMFAWALLRSRGRDLSSGPPVNFPYMSAKVPDMPELNFSAVFYLIDSETFLLIVNILEDQA
jgi:hypothetical protein